MSRKEKRNNNNNNNNNNKINKIVIILSIIFILAISYLAYYFISRNKDKSAIKKVQNNTIGTTIFSGTTPEEDIKSKVKELKNQNEDIKGWIKIEDTKIDYPVLQTTDNEFYLTHDYMKDENKYGSIYIKDGCDINDVNSNIILYGHNMLDDEMFNNLVNYASYDFYESHPVVHITTENEDREYTIISAFRSRVFYQDEKNVFRYYNYLNFKDEAEYNEFVENINKAALYDTGLTAEYGEQLLTMITCEYSRENGRMVVVAKRTK